MLLAVSTRRLAFNGLRVWGCSGQVKKAFEVSRNRSRRAEVSRNLLRKAVECSDLPSGSTGLGSFLEYAMVSRRAASARFVLFAVRRASEVAGLKASDISVVDSRGVVELKVRRQKNDQFGVGQTAHMVVVPPWRGACPVQLTMGLLVFRGWSARNRDYARKMPSAS